MVSINAINTNSAISALGKKGHINMPIGGVSKDDRQQMVNNTNDADKKERVDNQKETRSSETRRKEAKRAEERRAEDRRTEDKRVRESEEDITTRLNTNKESNTTNKGQTIDKFI